MTQAEQRTWRRPPVVACIPVFNEEREVVGVLDEALVLDEASHVGCISRLRLTWL